MKLFCAAVFLWLLYAIGLDGILGYMDRVTEAVGRSLEAYEAKHPYRPRRVDPVDVDSPLPPLKRQPYKREPQPRKDEPQRGYQWL